MREINCHFPITLRITGHPSDAQLDQLGGELTRALAERMAFAERTLAAHYNVQTGSAELVRAVYDPSRADAATESYYVPFYNDRGQNRRVQVQRRRKGGRRWRIEKETTIRLKVLKFAEYLERLQLDSLTADIKVLHPERLNETQTLAVQLVVANEAIDLYTLVDEVKGRIEKSIPAGKEWVGFHTHREGDRQRLLALDEKSKLAEWPDMTYNPGFVTPAGGVVLRPGGMVLFGQMTFPAVTEGILLKLGEEVTISLPLHALAFIVSGKGFERLFGISWDDHLSEFGDRPASLQILPVFPLRQAHFRTLKYFVEENVAARVEKDSAYFGNLYLLNQNMIDQLPVADRAKARSLTNDQTMALSESRREEWWEPNWVGAFIYAVVNPAADRFGRSQAESKKTARNEPSETPEHLVDRFTRFGNLNEDGLGAYLVGLIRQSPAFSDYVQRVLDELGTTNRDDVSLALAEHASDADLTNLAQSPDGRRLLVRLYDELTSGNLGESEQKQAERILVARVQSRSPEVAGRRLTRNILRGWIFPFRQSGPTAGGGAPIIANRLSDGRIKVRIPVHVKGTNPYRAEALTLPGDVFTSGLILDADEWVKVKLYDEGEVIVIRPALYLLEISNKSTTQTLESIATVIVTVGTLGVGGGAVGALSWGARALIYLDRAAVVISVITIVVRDHRGWFIKTFGEAGRKFVEAVEIAGAIAGIYGLGRLVFAAPKLISNLRSAWRSWRESRAFRSLSGDDLKRAEAVSRQTEQFLKNADEAVAAGQKELAAGGSGSPKPVDTPTPPPQPQVKPSEPAPQIKLSEPAPVEPVSKAPKSETVASKGTTKKPLSPVAKIERELKSLGIAPDVLRKFTGGKRINTDVAKRVRKLADHFTPDDLKKLGEYLSKNKITINDDLVDAFILKAPRGKMGDFLDQLDVVPAHEEATGSPRLSAQESELEKITTIHPGKPPRLSEIVETPGSRALRASLIKRLGEPPPGYHAHHIIPEKEFAEGIEWMRERLRNANSGINEADNGVFLAARGGTGKKLGPTPNPDLTRLHNSYIHAGPSKEYAYTLTRRLSGKHGQEFLDELQTIGNEMRTGQFKIDEIPHGWKGKWKSGMSAPVEPGVAPHVIEE